MSTETSSDPVVRRAALHAALGDPGRLTIVDTLAWGEASPGELAARLGMTSNLLAHHLRVLEEVGLVTRHRSEGDRRRSYVALRRAALDLLTPAGPPVTAERVVFVCTHNSARSQLAAAMWNDHSPVPATSAGTHPALRVHPGAIAVAHRRHLALVPAPPRQVQDVLDPADLVVTVCDSAHEELATASTGGAVARPGLHWSIPDPVRADDPAAFDAVVDELTDRISRLTPAVHAIPDPKDQERSS
jgi:ArsR family transcriptional regulator, arsenate/arsenite/antimonite-responsive transcriptional repressor / arsenate reductase (thioredoxin)